MLFELKQPNGDTFRNELTRNRFVPPKKYIQFKLLSPVFHLTSPDFTHFLAAFLEAHQTLEQFKLENITVDLYLGEVNGEVGNAIYWKAVRALQFQIADILRVFTYVTFVKSFELELHFNLPQLQGVVQGGTVLSTLVLSLDVTRIDALWCDLQVKDLEEDQLQFIKKNTVWPAVNEILFKTTALDARNPDALLSTLYITDFFKRPFVVEKRRVLPDKKKTAKEYLNDDVTGIIFSYLFKSNDAKAMVAAFNYEEAPRAESTFCGGCSIM